MAGFIYRQNNVPYYQRLFQKHDGLRQWEKTARSKVMLYPYYAMLSISICGSMYMVGRTILGKKTWFGK